MARNRILNVISFLCRLIVAGVFLDAAVMKIRDPATFAEQTGNYQFFPELSNYIAVTLPSIELVAALLLILTVKEWRTAASMALAGMLVVFTVAIARGWAMGINLECGCFGTGSSHIGPVPILRNLGLMAALAFSYSLDRKIHAPRSALAG